MTPVSGIWQPSTTISDFVAHILTEEVFWKTVNPFFEWRKARQVVGAMQRAHILFEAFGS